MATLNSKTTFNNGALQYEVETVPELVPNVAETVISGDVWLEEIHLANTSGAAVTVTITDLQGTPVAVVPTVSIDANSDHLREFTGRYCPGGVSWVASVAGVIAGYIRGRR